ncbi:glycoside hydrolase family 81, partial [Brachionus plicatilis]
SDYSGACLYKELPCRPRNKDPFLGHSYASGLFEFADSKNQESTSEAINSYFAVRELGKMTGNQTLEDLGDYLLSTEIHATIVYWQVKKNSQIYSEPFSKNGVVGILWETKVDYATWFGGNVEFIYGIQMLPFTEITPSHLKKDWLTETRPIWSKSLSSGSIEEGWKGFMLMADAIVDPNRPGLSNDIHGLTGYDNGNTRTNTLFFYYFVGGSPGGGSGQVTGTSTSFTQSSSSSTTTKSTTTICSGFGCELVDNGKPDPSCGSSLYGCHNLAGTLVGCYDPQTATCFFG